LHAPDWLGALCVLGKVLLLAALQKLVNSLESATPLACLWATAKPCGSMVSLRLSALLWTRLLVSLARRSLVVVMVLLLHPLSPVHLQPLLTSALRKTQLR